MIVTFGWSLLHCCGNLEMELPVVHNMDSAAELYHCKNRLVVLTTGWLPQLQTIASCSYQSFTLVYDRV